MSPIQQSYLGDGVLLLTIEREEALNAADVELHRDLSCIWGRVDQDDRVAVSVITGAGRAFSAGGDLSMIEEMTRDYSATIVQWHDAGSVVEAMLAAKKPIVSAINGVAVGAGLAVALMADVSIISETARISDGHAKIGVAAGDHAAIIWPLLCGMAKAKYYLMTGEFLDGIEAERIGLVTKCVPEDQVLGAAIDVARKLSEGSVDAIRWTKHVMNAWFRQASPIFGESLALEMLGFLGEDAKEGVSALREKRAPRFPSADQYRGQLPD